MLLAFNETLWIRDFSTVPWGTLRVSQRHPVPHTKSLRCEDREVRGTSLKACHPSPVNQRSVYFLFFILGFHPEKWVLLLKEILKSLDFIISKIPLSSHFISQMNFSVLHFWDLWVGRVSYIICRTQSKLKIQGPMFIKQFLKSVINGTNP